MSKSFSGNSRRDFLLKTITLAPAVAIGASGLGGLAAVKKADAAEDIAPANHEARAYTPTFFTPEEYAFVSAAAARLIPADERGPGAVEAGAPEFIDRQMNTPYATGSNWYMQGPFDPDADPALGYQLPLVPRDVYRLGIAAADEHAKKQYGKVFAELETAQQEEMLGQMEAGKVTFSQVPAKIFFATLLQNTREGFFSDPIHGGNQNMVGWKLIGFPGARADFMDWVERGEAYPFPPVSIRGERA
ncbi:gluconate 2-dehydrogenase subunit 3 family protein [Nissabacter sp. SGAir0207]|uniref:gluconate 2-dehydrogenase subunit 3 family protein n=1 Tax=Nissabacter sp. SGAir0207 TaxID=2126321 RepID=UPI0010CCB46F|nr:gluconate 2-dehydrogenase subunit 3 family protein [Nissabacter sp. SGAir0207]QCR38343.1 gluconate 2-dehydrogenase [Nissabacter sp. SGAir0207]